MSALNKWKKGNKRDSWGGILQNEDPIDFFVLAWNKALLARFFVLQFEAAFLQNEDPIDFIVLAPNNAFHYVFNSS